MSLAEDSTLSAEARTEFLDRVMGKPKQRTENFNVNASLQDILRQYAEEDTLEVEEVKVDDDCILE